MTTLAIAALFVATLGYVLWPVFAPGSSPGRAGSRPGGVTEDDPLPLEQLQPPPGER